MHGIVNVLRNISIALARVAKSDGLKFLTFLVLKRAYFMYIGQYHGYWYPGPLRHQVISNGAIDYTK